MEYIHSDFLKNRLPGIGYKKIGRLYSVCMPRYMQVHPYSSFQIVSQTDDFELAKRIIDEQMFFNEPMTPKVDLPYYYCDIRDGTFYIRHLMMAPSEDILVEIYSGKFLVLL